MSDSQVHSPRDMINPFGLTHMVPLIGHPYGHHVMFQPMPNPGNASPTHVDNRFPAGPEKLSDTNLYIRGLRPETTDQDLHKMCEVFGKIVSTKAIIDNETGKCKGYGFVDFEHAGNAAKAVLALSADGQLVQMAKKQEEDPTNIYFSNLPDWIGDKALREMLEPYGEVVSTRILRHPAQNGSTEGKSKGVGFARMHLKEQCEKIIEKFNGQPLTDPNNINKSTAKPLLVKFADGGPKKKKSHTLNITQQFSRAGDMMMDTPIPMYLAPPIGPINYPPIAPIASYQSAYPFQQASFQPMPPMDPHLVQTNQHPQQPILQEHPYQKSQ